MLEKIWASHAILARPDGATLLHVDRHFVHDGSANAFRKLKEKGLSVRRPENTFATPDHYVPTTSRDAATQEPHRRQMVVDLDANARESGVAQFGLSDRRQGIVHVIGPEQALTQPGMLIVCGDSHTATHGAPGVHAKDVILAIIATIGAAGATGHAIEYAGSTLRQMSTEGRLTVCNMSIEAGARAGMVAPDDATFAYLHGKPYAPKGPDWDKALAYWRSLVTDAEARFDREVALDAAGIAPMVTWGTSPESAAAITGRVPDPAQAPDAARREAIEHALAYMDLKPGMALTDIAIDRVFLGSCTNSRIEDLRVAAKIVDGRKAVVPAMVVPGSGLVKAQAEAEGLDAVFKAGCSMCVGMNGDLVGPGERCASTSNRNFVGRQGKGARTHLVSPAMAAAAAVTGKLTDVRTLLRP